MNVPKVGYLTWYLAVRFGSAQFCVVTPIAHDLGASHKACAINRIAPSYEESEASSRVEASQEVSMRRNLLIIVAPIAVLAVGSVASNAAQTTASAHQKRGMHRQHTTAHPSSTDITSFSSSSVLHIGVNHPPKNR